VFEPLIAHSPDLRRLAEEGYELQLRSGGALLLVNHVPYVTEAREVKYGTLVTTLALAGDVTTTPDDHAVYFVGATPCDEQGYPLSKVINSSNRQSFNGVEVDHMFSSKPPVTPEAPAGYTDYYDKVTSYINMLLGAAQLLDPEASAQTFQSGDGDTSDPIFVYAENASIRAGIAAATDKLRIGKVAIVGLGGTGAYILDLLAKTPIGELHLFDGDVFLQHNAFRSPGAATIDELRQTLPKVVYLRDRYSEMRRHIVTHPELIAAENVDQLRDMDFVFIAIDHGPSRKLIVEQLEAWDKPFVDVGMGLGTTSDDAIQGMVRVTASTPGRREHVWSDSQVPFGEPDPDNIYTHNIQVADLNMLNAVLAVIRFKKLIGFYVDLAAEHSNFYSLDLNDLINEGAQE
jgi:hypothetical protein